MKRTEEEFKAEVFRRSRVRIAKRRRNINRIISCMTALFCIITISFYFATDKNMENVPESYEGENNKYTEGVIDKTEYNTVATEMENQPAKNNIILVEVKSQIEDEESYYKIRDKVKREAIVSVISAIELSTEIPDGDVTQNSSENNQETETSHEHEDIKYVITFTDNTGNTKEYILERNSLVVSETKQQHTASQGELEKLRKLLKDLDK